MKTVRIAIEWSYGNNTLLFKYVQNTEKLKLMQSDHVQKVYVAAALFRNIHLALYGGETSNYFKVTLSAEVLEQYCLMFIYNLIRDGLI